MALALLGAGCSTARQRDEPQNLIGNLRFRNAEAQTYFDQVYRSGNLYLDFRPVLVVDAIFKDQSFRRLYVSELQARYLLAPRDVDTLTEQNRQAFAHGMEFILFAYTGAKRDVRLNQGDAPWRIMLRDDDGQVLTPSSIRRMDANGPDFIYIDKYFYGVDRWSEGYLVTFPKLDKRLLGQAPGTGPMTL
ncbi:MAG: hypothetical protein HY342_11910, partial [Candidatus Lambdaproteobacteria bacterium]|nr:hypothetical protein [Candidatus Lambdaproteobacteria bacterium]